MNGFIDQDRIHWPWLHGHGYIGHGFIDQDMNGYIDQDRIHWPWIH